MVRATVWGMSAALTEVKVAWSKAIAFSGSVSIIRRASATLVPTSVFNCWARSDSASLVGTSPATALPGLPSLGSLSNRS